MKWGLSRGLLGLDNVSLAPSELAVGPNTYLDRNDFFKMLGAALFVHVLIFGIVALIPSDKVTNIPVRALSFKLGDADRIAAYSPVSSTVPTPQIVAAPVMQATERVAPTPLPVKPQKIQLKPEPKPQVQRQPAPQPQPELPLAALPQPPAIAAQPQQYVREVGQATQAAGIPTGAVGGQGTVNSQTDQTTREIRERYEQQISSWIQRHKLYPAEAGGRAGRVVIRMRIDRGGIVRYYAIEESSGIQPIDAAALDMIRRANPLPAAPANYPAGTLIEFLIPISFQAPQ